MDKSEVFKFCRSILIGVVIIISIDYFAVPQLFSFLLQKIDYNYFCYKKADVFILGDSHLERVLNSKLLKNKVIENFANAGQSLDLDYYIYKEYRDKFSAPEYVVLSTQLWMFKTMSYIAYVTSLTNKEYRKQLIHKRFYNYSNYLNRLRHLKFNLIENGTFISEAIWRFGLRQLKHRNNCISGQQDVFGNGKNSNTIATEFLDGTKTYIKNDYLTSRYSPYHNLNEINYSYFIKLLDLFKSDGVKIILYETPEFVGSTKSILNKNKFYDEIEKIIKNYPKVTFVKHNDLGLDENDPSNFTDGGYGQINSHLSKKGADLADVEFVRKYLRFY